MAEFALDKALGITEGFGTRECRQFRERIFRAHEYICPPLAHHYRRLALQEGHVAANTELRKLHKQLTLGRSFEGLFITSSDDEVKSFASRKAPQLKRAFIHILKTRGFRKALEKVISVLDTCGFEFPHPAPYEAGHDELAPALARTFCEQWWRRQIRRRQDTILETVHIKLGLVNKQSGIYASNNGVKRKLSQWNRNEGLLAKLVAENDVGQVFSLLDISKRGISNLTNRRNELMTRLSGFEATSAKRGDVGIFVTLTAPSKYHSFLSKPCIPNPKYQGYTPADAQAYFNRQWSKVRAKLDRMAIKPYGFRVVEPHHDGCPHWHLLLFLPQTEVKPAIEVMRHYALEVDGHETGADKHRLKVEYIDPDKGTATGYIAKYIAKNIDGVDVGEDLYGHEAIESATRIRAWASTWGIRQFQQLGGPAVTAWRECRRLSHSDLKEAVLDSVGDEKLAEIVKAADEGDWERFVDLSGGPTVARKDQPLRAYQVTKPALNKYGEEAKKLLGLLYRGVEKVRTRFFDWTIRPMAVSEQGGEYSPLNFSSGGANAPPLEFCQ
ncbi:replication endonuclease [Microbulbifer sp. YPW16]|uniref:replication endonuclease n=1 Tax=Microbulbifer sp. YPW16 TaxID=2904242 RepID=UPI001E402D1B|nr:replication endonuclease [Microbulbifer sp. YPW16]UHQ54773.1 replication endonuclease [Microbulbifer sp. YPW16]